MFPNKTRIDSLKTLIQAYWVDLGRIFQKGICYDSKRKWSFVIAWGYTIQIYPWFVTAFDLHKPLQTFKTWRSWNNGPFTFNTRTMPVDPCKWPIVYFLNQVEEVGMSGTRTSYKFAKSEKTCNKSNYAPVMAVNNITISSMKMAPDYWQKALHRQCL
ncbi:hypothetical protein REPUB_Repub01dG0088600 [Reevesia pubescens]